MYFKWHYLSISSHIFWEFIFRFFNVVTVKLLLTLFPPPPRDSFFVWVSDVKYSFILQNSVSSTRRRSQIDSEESDESEDILDDEVNGKKRADFYRLIKIKPSRKIPASTKMQCKNLEFSWKKWESRLPQKKQTENEIQCQEFLFSAQCVMCATAYRVPMAASDCECWWTYWILWAE